MSFSGTITDLTTNTVLDTFFQAKGNGNRIPPETATAGELGIPGVDPNDVIQFDFTAQVVLKP